MTQIPAPIFKYHGTGNDFVVVDASDWTVDVAALAPYLCDRHRGVGADGVIIVEIDPLIVPEGFDAVMSIYNRDGSRPEMCGNGIRCVARHLVSHHGLSQTLRVSTDAGERRCVVRRDGEQWEVDVDMGIAVSTEPVAYNWGGSEWTLHPVDMGNPHAVVFRTAETSVADGIGAELNGPRSPFKQGVNVEFVTLDGDAGLDVLVYERGVGRTQACGTGACAAAVAAWETDRATAESLDVKLPGGVLTIRREGDRVWMRGGVEYVFGAHLHAGWLEART